MTPARFDPAAEEVLAEAGAAATLDDLARAAGSCVRCPGLAAERSSVVTGDFPAGARVLLVGEAPGAQEDLSGRPFVGKAGQLLDRLLDEAGLSRHEVAVANVLKCRPPGNRAPTRAEAGRCRPWLDRQVELVDPEVVVTLGGTAAAWACGAGARLSALRGTVHDWHDRRLVVTYHPSAAIRFGPAGAPMAALRADLKLVAAALS